MLRQVILFSAFCIFLAASITIVKPGPAYPPTNGEIWPKPHTQTKDSTYYKLIPSSFNITATGQTCEILKSAIERYMDVLRSTYLIAYRHSRQIWKHMNYTVTDSNYKGILQQLQINLTAPCEAYPYLDMDEKYSLSVSEVSVLNSDSIWGALRGLETFVQMFYMASDYNNIFINTTEVIDYPQYKHRGLLIDTGRHYLSVSTILKILDAMEMNKMNVLHWHIVDDQSFPYFSELFPQLCAPYDPKMIYTGMDINRIVNYAKERGIRVVPEFDVPGHTSSWGLAYPGVLTECFRFGKKVGLGPMDPTKNLTYKLINDLFHEVQTRFPDEYFHVGGDEVDMDCWISNPRILEYMEQHNMSKVSALHSLFMSKVLPLLGERSKPIVWQEVFDEHVTMPNGTIVQVWKTETAYEMRNILIANHKVLYSASWYLDQLAGGGDWQKYYVADPRRIVGASYPELDLNNIIGGEACMWGEVVDDTNVLTRVWPRASAVAEVLWSGGPRTRNVSYRVRCRIEEHTCRMNRRGIHAQPPNGPGFCVTGN